VDGITPVVAERTEDNEAYIDAAPDKNNAKKFPPCILIPIIFINKN
jgi:hypothetical protein